MLHNLIILFVGPLPKTQTGLKYVLTLTDYFTKYVELFPLRQKSGLCGPSAQRLLCTADWWNTTKRIPAAIPPASPTENMWTGWSVRIVSLGGTFIVLNC